MKVIVDKDGFEKELREIIEDFLCKNSERVYWTCILEDRIMDAFNFYSEDVNE